MKMQWSLEVSRDGVVVHREEELMADEFGKLISAKDDTRGKAGITLSYGESTEFSRQKYHITVSLTCDQNASAIDRAYELAVKKVEELSQRVERELGQ